MSKHNPFVMVMQIGENSAYCHSDKVVSLPPFAEKYMQRHGLKKGKFVHINNGVVIEDWMHPQALPEEHEQTLKQLKNDGKFVVGYFGGHALSNALEDLLSVAKAMRSNAKIHFVLVGDGAEKKNLQAFAAEQKLENVTFLPPVSKYAIPTLAQNFDCCYIGVKDSPLYRFGIAMNKIFDSMMAGKPMVLCGECTKQLCRKISLRSNRKTRRY